MITILRLGHRLQRDSRISTHCGLVARAFGASEIIFSGEQDKEIIQSLKKVVKNWGGPFSVRYEKNYRKIINAYKKKRFTIVHLTMYGLSIKKQMKKIKKNVLVIIGGEKVPGEIYHLADYNIAVTNQPHSEVAALAVFLNSYFKGKEKKFTHAKLKVIPQKHGKLVS